VRVTWFYMKCGRKVKRKCRAAAAHRIWTFESVIAMMKKKGRHCWRPSLRCLWFCVKRDWRTQYLVAGDGLFDVVDDFDFGGWCGSGLDLSDRDEAGLLLLA
jgi:hypothetical protein